MPCLVPPLFHFVPPVWSHQTRLWPKKAIFGRFGPCLAIYLAKMAGTRVLPIGTSQSLPKQSRKHHWLSWKSNFEKAPLTNTLCLPGSEPPSILACTVNNDSRAPLAGTSATSRHGGRPRALSGDVDEGRDRLVRGIMAQRWLLAGCQQPPSWLPDSCGNQKLIVVHDSSRHHSVVTSSRVT